MHRKRTNVRNSQLFFPPNNQEPVFLENFLYFCQVYYYPFLLKDACVIIWCTDYLVLHTSSAYRFYRGQRSLVKKLAIYFQLLSTLLWPSLKLITGVINDAMYFLQHTSPYYSSTSPQHDSTVNYHSECVAILVKLYNRLVIMIKKH